MNFIDLIKDSNTIDEIRNKISSSGSPTVLYGAAAAGLMTYDYLTENRIKVDAIAVDKEYLPNVHARDFNGTRVYSIEEVCDKISSSVNLFIGFYARDLPALVNKKKHYLMSLGLSANIFMLDIHVLMYPARLFSFEFIKNNVEEFSWLYNTCLADQRSRDVLVAFINQRISMVIGELSRVRDDDQYFLQSIIKLSTRYHKYDDVL